MCIGRNLYQLFSCYFFTKTNCLSTLARIVEVWRSVDTEAHGVVNSTWHHKTVLMTRCGMIAKVRNPYVRSDSWGSWKTFRCLLFRAAFLSFYLHAEDQNCICWITVHYTSPVLLKYTEHETHRTRNSSGQHDSAQCIRILCRKETVYWLYVDYERRFTHRATNRCVRGFVLVRFLDERMFWHNSWLEFWLQSFKKSLLCDTLCNWNYARAQINHQL